MVGLRQLLEFERLCDYSLDTAVRVCLFPDNIPPSLYSVPTGGPSAASKGADV